ncbi:MAG: hypothetical protein ACD_77C00308G0002 [uncultured bacterium]|nr:MAG: hypothetical protein ACD_77C00308G0002 [uncultured bacterium]
MSAGLNFLSPAPTFFNKSNYAGIARNAAANARIA